MKRLVEQLAALLILAAIFASCGGANNAVRTPATSAAQNGALEKLQSLPIPEGADPAVFQMLRDELTRQLAQNGWKSASAPPDPAKPGNDVADLALAPDGTDWALEWTFKSLGDYDQNGAVGVSDITPLAAHFGHNAADALDALIDLDQNGVGVSDVTAIAQNFGVTVGGYAVMQSANGVDWTEIDRAPFASEHVTEPRRLSFTLPAPNDLDMFRVRVYDSTEAAFGKESNAVRFAAYDLTVELVVASTPPVSGIGTEPDPYVVQFNTTTPIEYDIRVFYAKGEAGEVELTDQVTFETFPPAFISFGAATLPEAVKMTVDNPMAGSFNITAVWGDVAPLETDPLYFRVQGGLPG